MTIPDSLRISDPHGLAARKAARVTVVMGVMVTLSNTVVDNANFSTFAIFGSFALLSFADFGGSLRTRFVAGIVFGLCGSAWIVVGTAASGHAVSTVAVMAIAAFTMTYGEAVGGHVAAGGRGMVLATILALMTPGGFAVVGDRVGGWMVASAVGALASVVLWPTRERRMIQTELARISTALGPLLGRLPELTDVDIEPVRAQITSLRERIDAMLTRPSGPRAKDRALLYLLDEAERSTMFLGDVVALLGSGSTLEPEDLRALERSADVLESLSSVLLEHGSGPSVADLLELRALEMDRVEAAMDSAPGVSAARGSALLERFDLLFPLRMLSYLALSMSANALIAAGSRPTETEFEFQLESPVIRNDFRSATGRLVETLRANLTPRSRWFRNGARAALALGAAVALADAVSLDRSFWIVLGAMSALRSSVADTGVTVLHSLLGTIGGFLVATALILVVGPHQWAMWVLLPITIFLATYTARAVGYAVGQGAFTVMSVVMLNLAEPVGWHLGLVRVHRVGIGVAVAIAAALLLWPRGVTHDLAAAVRVELRNAADYLRRGLRNALVGFEQGPTEHSRRLALDTRAVAEGELGDLMNSRGTKHVPVDTWARLVAQPYAVILGGSWMSASARSQGAPAVASSSAPSVQHAARALCSLADQLGVETRADAVPDVLEELSSAGLDDARSALGEVLDDDSAHRDLDDRQIITLLWSYQWLRFARRLGDDMVAPLGEVREALAKSWWR